MRFIAFLISMAFLTASCSSSGSKSTANESSDKVSISEENLHHIHLDVSGMTCEGCEKAIVAGINQLDGIREASASHTNAEATVVFDTTLTSVREIANAIEEAGYGVDGEPAQNHH